jgi:hypothetical protein
VVFQNRHFAKQMPLLPECDHPVCQFNGYLVGPGDTIAMFQDCAPVYVGSPFNGAVLQEWAFFNEPVQGFLLFDAQSFFAKGFRFHWLLSFIGC